MAMQLGLIGMVLLFAPLIFLFIRELRSANPSSTRIALQGVLLAGLVACITESWVYSVGNSQAFPFWCAVALLELLREQQESNVAPLRSPYAHSN